MFGPPARPAAIAARIERRVVRIAARRAGVVARGRDWAASACDRTATRCRCSAAGSRRSRRADRCACANAWRRGCFWITRTADALALLVGCCVSKSMRGSRWLAMRLRGRGPLRCCCRAVAGPGLAAADLGRCGRGPWPCGRWPCPAGAGPAPCGRWPCLLRTRTLALPPWPLLLLLAGALRAVARLLRTSALRMTLEARGFHHRGDFRRFELERVAALHHRRHRERAVARADEPRHRHFERFEQAPHLAVAPFLQHDVIPVIGALFLAAAVLDLLALRDAVFELRCRRASRCICSSLSRPSTRTAYSRSTS